MQYAHIESGLPLSLMAGAMAVRAAQGTGASLDDAVSPRVSVPADPLFEASPLPAWLLDSNGVIVASSLRAREDMARCGQGSPLAGLLAQEAERDLLSNALTCSLAGFPVTSAPLSLLNVQGQAVAGELYISTSPRVGQQRAITATFAPHRGEAATAPASTACPVAPAQMEDLRTLASAASGFAQIIQSSVHLSELVRASDIERHVEDLVVCTSQLIGLSEEIFDAGAVPAEQWTTSGAFEVNALLAHVIEEARRSYAPLELSLTWEPLEQCVSLTGGWRRVARLVRTLLDNAARFSVRRSTVQLSVQVSDGKVSVGVHDEGPRLSEGAVQAPFRARSEARARVTAHRDANGLALYFAHRHAVEIGGGLRCEPRAVCGASFWLDLPVAAQEPG